MQLRRENKIVEDELHYRAANGIMHSLILNVVPSRLIKVNV